MTTTVTSNLKGTLEHDVRGDLIEEVSRRGWKYNADIEFPTLATLPAFKGHTPHSLCQLYGNLLIQVVGKQKRMKGVGQAIREVTVIQVNEWWNGTTKTGKPFKKTGKTPEKRRREDELVSAYNVVVTNLGLEPEKLWHTNNFLHILCFRNLAPPWATLWAKPWRRACKEINSSWLR